MASFEKLQSTPYPPRHWALFGYPSAGKSTFLAAMRQPLLAIDADGRIRELQRLGADIHTISRNPKDHHNCAAIFRLISEADTQSIGTVCVDSVTSILAPIVALAMAENRADIHKNKASAFVAKSDDMRLLQGAVTRAGCDVALIWHYEDGRDQNGKECRKQTVPETERARLVKSLNVALEIGKENGRRYAKVTWSRVGKRDVVIYDDQGLWKGVPEKIEEALYGPPAPAQQAVRSAA